MTPKMMKGASRIRQGLTLRVLVRFVPFLALSLGACSLLADFSGVQCERTEDCLARGPAFQGTICQAEFCVTPSASGGSGGGSSSGGTSSGGSTGSNGNVGGMAGDTSVECVTNDDCIEANFGTPWVCRAGECISLTLESGQCPIVLGAGENLEYLRNSTDPILLGAYSTVDAVAPKTSPVTLNYELAIEEINFWSGGGVSGPKGRRPFIAILCDSQHAPDFDESMNHLLDLGVTTVIPFVYAEQLLNLFETYAAPNNLLFLSPLDADSSLTILQDKGLMWHMLAPASDLAVAYPDLVARAEAHVRTQRAMAAYPEAPVRVAMVQSRSQINSELADAVVNTIRFNGMGALEANNKANFKSLLIDSSLEVANPDLSEAVSEILTFQPHILITLGFAEMPKLIQTIEVQWQKGWADCPVDGTGKCPPFHVVGWGSWQSTYLANSVPTSVYSRLLGVNYASTSDQAELSALNNRLSTAYGSLNNDGKLEGYENFYDAMYYAAFALAGAGSKEAITGKDVLAGLERIIDTDTPTVYKVGNKSHVLSGLSTLTSTTGTFQLKGVMGLPDFNLTTGARHGWPSVYCMEAGQNGEAATYVPDVLRYDPVTQTLTGQQTCVPDFPDSAP